MKTRDCFLGAVLGGVILMCVSCQREISSPEERFEAYLLQEYDRNGDGMLDRNECLDVDTIIWKYGDLVSMDGLQRFENLVYLNCAGNRISGLDLSGNLKIRYVDVALNPLSVLDVSKNTSIESLNIKWTGLQALSLPPDVKLEYLACGYNDLQDFDGIPLENYTRLKKLDCSHNDFLSLKLALPTLESLDCSDNARLEHLDLDSCPNLVDLAFANCRINDLDISSCANLESLYCPGCQLDTLNLTTFSKLYILYCEYNNLFSLDFSGNPELKVVYAHMNKLAAVDLSPCPKMERAVFGPNERIVPVENNRFDLRKLGEGFDWAKVAACYGGRIDDGILYWDEDRASVTYRYATGSSNPDFQTVAFTLRRE